MVLITEDWLEKMIITVLNAINIGVTYFDLSVSLNRKLGTVLSSAYISNLRYSSLHKAQVSFDGFQSICCPF